MSKLEVGEKTVLEHFETLPQGEFRDFVFANLDERYTHQKCHVLNYALTFGVRCPNKGDWQRIENYITQS
jgi:hypothetical protein